MIAITNLTENEVYQRLSEPHNPPRFSGSFTEDDFSREWHLAQNSLERVLRRFGQNDCYGQADYYLGDTLVLSRGIGLELTSKKMFNKLLIPSVQTMLAELDQDYEIDFAILTKDGFSHVFVTKSQVLGWCPSKILRLLGLKALK